MKGSNRRETTMGPRVLSTGSSMNTAMSSSHFPQFLSQSKRLKRRCTRPPMLESCTVILQRKLTEVQVVWRPLTLIAADPFWVIDIPRHWESTRGKSDARVHGSQTGQPPALSSTLSIASLSLLLIIVLYGVFFSSTPLKLRMSTDRQRDSQATSSRLAKTGHQTPSVDPPLNLPKKQHSGDHGYVSVDVL